MPIEEVIGVTSACIFLGLIFFCGIASVFSKRPFKSRRRRGFRSGEAYDDDDFYGGDDYCGGSYYDDGGGCDD